MSSNRLMRALNADEKMAVRIGGLVISAERQLSPELLTSLRLHRDEIIELWNERAAIREFHGNLSKHDAEVAASIDLMRIGQ